MALDIHPQFIVDENGERTAVQLSIAEFEALMEQVEDYLDATRAEEVMRSAKAEDFVDWEAAKARLRALDN
jgi:PHD/YefM family antitoxin component YafN of YafNO toxin-antitoxin module